MTARLTCVAQGVAIEFDSSNSIHLANVPLSLGVITFVSAAVVEIAERRLARRFVFIPDRKLVHVYTQAMHGIRRHQLVALEVA
jgi:hypothetical protein